MVTFSRVPRCATIQSQCFFLTRYYAFDQAGKAKGIFKRVIDLLPILAYEGNEYRLIATKKNRIGYFD